MTAPTSLSLESNFELERIKRSIDAMDDLELEVGFQGQGGRRRHQSKARVNEC